MSRLHSFYVPLLAITVVLMSGALSFHIRSDHGPATESFIAQPVRMAENLAGLTKQPDKLMDLVLEGLSPKKVHWLEMKVRQHMRNHAFSFEARSSLVMGRDHCARLETTVQSGGAPGHVLVVCDGAVLAQVHSLPGQSQQTTTLRLPETMDQPGLVERDRILVEKGCGGPYPLLLDLRMKLKGLEVTTGMLDGQSVLRFSGSLDPAAETVAEHLRISQTAQTCHLFVDAQSLLPVRIERWDNGGLLLELAFEKIQVNLALSHERCVKEFTFTP